MIAGVVKEAFPGERRVALTPLAPGLLAKAGIEVVLEAGAGVDAGYPDQAYTDKNARVISTRKEVFAVSDVIVQVRCYGSNMENGRDDLELLSDGKTVVGLCEPVSHPEAMGEIAATGATLFSMEMMPRITRAQGMDVLSSMATIAGYKAVVLAANNLPMMFPMLMTAAGTVNPARVLILGAGVAGLQAIATAKRLGALVSAYDIRPVVKEQVESLGAKFVELDLKTNGAENGGGYAKAQDEEFYRRQRELMAEVIAENDVVITTAAVPGRKAPVLVTSEMITGMRAGSVIVDLAAEQGGNCEPTSPGEVVFKNGVKILGPVNVHSTIPYHASQMYSRNMATFLRHLVEDGSWRIDTEDEITAGTLITTGGKVVHPAMKE